MAREGLMDDCGYHGFDECARYEECCDEAYERGRYDEREELQRAFERLLGNEYSWQEICDMADELKGEDT